MAILIYHKEIYIHNWVKALKGADQTLDIRIYPETGDVEDILFGITAAGYPEGLWRRFPNLKALSSIGAGVSHILEDASLPPDLPVLKLVDKRLNQSMWEYILATVTYCSKHLHRYQMQQRESVWKELRPNSFDRTTVGVLGLGSIGSFVAQHLATLGFMVKGFANSHREIGGVEVSKLSEASDEIMASVDIWISILPLTAQTENIFDQHFFSRLKEGAVLINVGRGHQVVDDDLIDALDCGQLSYAYLDVFREEPLPESHPFWRHPQISTTPHIASITSPRSVAEQIVSNYYRALAGEPLDNVVDRVLGY